MENIIELLVKKEKDKFDFIKKTGLIIISLIIAFLVFVFFFSAILITRIAIY